MIGGTYVLDTLGKSIVADEAFSLLTFCVIEPVYAFVDESAEDVDADDVGDGGARG